MHPLSNDEKKAILQKNPLATQSDIEEYERLLSQRYTTDPSVPQPAAAPEGEPLETRLKTLHAKLYPEKYNQ